jgi:hypothetical protein
MILVKSESDRLTVLLLLSPEEKDNPLSVLTQFNACFDLEFAQSLNRFLLTTVLSLDDEELGLECSRKAIVLYFEQIGRLIEAGYLLDPIK